MHLAAPILRVLPGLGDAAAQDWGELCRKLKLARIVSEEY
jgi:hypothetical protein